AIVLHGREKLDEAGLADLSDLALLKDGQVQMMTLDPEALGLTSAPTAALRGGEIEDNTDILCSVLQGRGTQAQTDVVALNAALALKVGGAVNGITVTEAYIKGIAMAQDILKSGAAWTKLEQLVAFLKQ
ncbi:MAG: anthranilate phosphoribosyltransferase, partial [Cyanothece sp. SIO1E1]|nr:anthranilate phosphoribosyltransferase [Cyanothece sp. SIO1E1]